MPTTVKTVDGSQHTDSGEDISKLLNMDPLDLLQRANDGACGSVCAVLDLTRRDVFVEVSYMDKIREYLLPGAENLSEKLRDVLGMTGTRFTAHPTGAQKAAWGLGSKNDRPNYHLSTLHKERLASLSHFFQSFL